MDGERTLPCLVGSQKCRGRLLEPADHELHTGILDVRNRASRAECPFGEHWGPVFRQTLDRNPSLKSTSGAHCGLVSQRRSDCISHAPRNPSVRNLPSWASVRIDKAETGKRTGRKFTCWVLHCIHDERESET